MIRARIAGIEKWLPEKVVTNAELDAAHPGWRMNEVVLQTGVWERRIARADETSLDLGQRAAELLLERMNIPPDGIDGLIFCTQTPDQVMPPNACLLQHRLGLSKSTACFDFTLACSGFLYGLFMARAFIISGACRRVLLVTSETYSKLMNQEDRGTMTLFGDGAAATLVEASEEGGARAPHIGAIILGTDGSHANCFEVPASGARTPSSVLTREAHKDKSGNIRTSENIHMNGAEVLNFVRREVPANVQAVLAHEGITLADIGLVLFHQASQASLNYLKRALAVDDTKLYSNLATTGNTVSASIPIALRDAEIEGRLSNGTTVLLSGFGVGLSWGAAVVQF
jgi:3-oxoacyl-[acyl-carrier-protein] synthase-3